MRVHVEMDLAGLNLAATVGAGRDARRRRWLIVLAALLTLPFTLLLGLSALGAGPRVDGGLLGSFVTLSSLGPPVALVVLAVATIRVRAGRSTGGWSAQAEALLSRGELLVAAIALVVAVLYFGHLAADAFACANGNRATC